MKVNIVCQIKRAKKIFSLDNIFERLIEKMKEFTSINGKPQA
jgi:hypothetical protein